MRRTPLGWLSVLLLIATSAWGQTGPGGARPRITLDLEANALVVHGAEPSGQVAWFGVERWVDPDLSVTRRARQGIVPAGADGVARILLDPPPADRALWVVVDLKSGDFVAGAPDGYRLTRLERDRTPCRGEARDGDQEDGLLDARAQIEGLMIRPAEGAWRFSGGDGGPDDDDRAHDGRLRLALSKFSPVGSSPKAPRKIEGRDLWFVIDPVAMDLSVLKGGVAQ